MTGAFLTTIFFSFSVIFANRSIRSFGSTRANLGRLFVAIIFLGAWAHLFGSGLHGAGLNYFLLSGLVGMGLGDLALFATLPRLGSRLSILMVQCVAAPIGALGDWLCLGTRLTGPQILWGAVILTGIAVAMMPTKNDPPKVRISAAGFIFGLLAAAGQGFGAVLSRMGYDLAAEAQQSIDGISAAYQRCLGGLVITLAWFAVVALIKRSDAQETESRPTPPKWHLLWLLGNGLFGPVIGVSCYQWALATTPSGIVLPIVATTPLVILPLAYLIEGERPNRRSLLGGIIAVAGAVGLAMTKSP